MAGFSKKNVESELRNGKSKESRTIVKYVTQAGNNGANGADAFQVILSPNNHTFAAGTDDQLDRVNVFVFRGTTPINAFIVESEIQGEIGKGSTNALVVDVDASYNGTNRAFFDVKANRFLDVDSSILIIPIQYNVDVFDSSTAYDSSMWDASTYNIATFNAVYSWNMTSSGQSAYALDLSNENASINADASGNIIRDAVRPTCKATLTYGAQDVTSNVYYDMSWTMAGVTGIGINHQTGEVLWDSSAHSYDSEFPSGYFNFGDASTNTILEVTIDASFNDGMHRQKVMSISKSLPGQSGIPGDPGDDAVSRWIELSADAIRVDASNNCIPPTITATPWKQIGGNTPAVDQSTNIKWAYDSSVTSTAYTGAITINSSKDYMTFKLYYQNTYLGECETVPILRDGKNGQPGAQGRKGPAVRGPWLWDSSNNVNKTGLSPRRFCNGDGSTNITDGDWIDIIIHDGAYYRCTTSYNSTVNDTWTGSPRPVNGYWAVTDASYEFVAAHLLLAENAKINFLSGNELYLMNSNNRITAGAAGGNGISFWAGAEQPSAAAFQVDYHGNIKATSGTFSGYIQIPFTHIGALQHNGTTYYADNRAYLISPESASNDPVNFVLPTPSSSWSGFTYDILVTPRRVAGRYGNQLVTRVYNNSDISIFAYAEERTVASVTLTGGRYTITCIPIDFDSSYNGIEFQWCIINATAGLIIHGNRDEYVSTLLGTSYESWDMINKVLTYTSTNGKPSGVPWANNTMYVEK